MPAMNDPDVLKDTDDDGCPWCPHAHSALEPCPDGEWVDEDGDSLAEDPTLIQLAFAVADLPAGPVRRRGIRLWLIVTGCKLGALAVLVAWMYLIGRVLGSMARAVLGLL